jgi:capping protein beta
MRRLPPSKTEFNLSGLINLMPDLTDELLQRVDQPLQVATDPVSGRRYLMCDYNRDGDSYRSPWSNQYDPPIEDAFMPPDELRAVEAEANEVFDAYRQLYFEGGVSSVYMWDLDGSAFAACFLIKKDVGEGGRSVSKGCWDSIHVMEVQPEGGSATYKLTSTVMLAMSVQRSDAGSVDLSGSLTRQSERRSPVSAVNTHVVNMGKMIEAMETDLRSSLDQLYVQKTREVLSGIRKSYAAGGAGPSQSFVNSLNAAVLSHGAGRRVD